MYKFIYIFPSVFVSCFRLDFGSGSIHSDIQRTKAVSVCL